GARLPDRLVWRQPAGHGQVEGGRTAHCAVDDQGAGAGHDPVRRSHRAAAVGGSARPARPRACQRHAARPAGRSYRHGGERPRPRALLDAAHRLARRHSAQATAMTSERRFDWRVPAIWAVMLTVSVFAHAYVEVANEASRGHPIGYGRALITEA